MVVRKEVVGMDLGKILRGSFFCSLKQRNNYSN